MLTDDPIKAARKIGTVVTTKAYLRSMVSFDFMAGIIAASGLGSNSTLPCLTEDAISYMVVVNREEDGRS